MAALLQMYGMIRCDILLCAQKLTESHLNLRHGVKD